MKTYFLTSLFVMASFMALSQVAKSADKQPDSKKKLMIVEASCGECNFELPGDDCDLAVKVDGKAYYVDGVSILEYGHPHKHGGFCVAVRHAEVQGEVVNGRFKASYFKLLKDDHDHSEEKK